MSALVTVVAMPVAASVVVVVVGALALWVLSNEPLSDGRPMPLLFR